MRFVVNISANRQLPFRPNKSCSYRALMSQRRTFYPLIVAFNVPDTSFPFVRANGRKSRSISQ